jgi:tetratricopeptide (TPR) repeat protein
MLDVPPFTAREGSALLAASGGGWLPDQQRRELVASVDGHALAVAALGGVLADRPPTGDVQGLRAELATAATTDARVAKVLNFYAVRLTEADRYLVAAVALFAHPATPAALLSVAGHEAFGGRLNGWTAQQVQAAARDRLAGLLSWHPDGTLSAHPLVRDTFRPLALGAAEVAVEATLTDIPAGTIGSREQGLAVVEAIELLLDADQWLAADDLHRKRANNGLAWKSLPAARLGQRAASAFVATPARRAACPVRLTPHSLGYYLNEVGLFAMLGGDLATAREYLAASIRQYRTVEDWGNLSAVLQNLSECLCGLGEVQPAGQAAQDAVVNATRANNQLQTRNSQSRLAWPAVLAGDSRAAEEHFLAADRLVHSESPSGHHTYSIEGVWWAGFLARTDRADVARLLTKRNQEISARNEWNENLARCDRILGALDLAEGDPSAARRRLTGAVTIFRDGEFLVELAATLPVLADCARAQGELDAADQHIDEVLDIAAPRGLRPTQAAALVIRARIHADRGPDHLARGRDAAQVAYRIANRHQLAWHELDAMAALARLDQVEGIDNGWSRRAAALRDRLIPAGLDPDPLATVERQVAARKAGANGNG